MSARQERGAADWPQGGTRQGQGQPAGFDYAGCRPTVRGGGRGHLWRPEPGRGSGSRDAAPRCVVLNWGARGEGLSVTPHPTPASPLRHTGPATSELRDLRQITSLCVPPRSSSAKWGRDGSQGPGLLGGLHDTMSGRLVAQAQDRVTHGASTPACGFWGARTWPQSHTCQGRPRPAGRRDGALATCLCGRLYLSCSGHQLSPQRGHHRNQENAPRPIWGHCTLLAGLSQGERAVAPRGAGSRVQGCGSREMFLLTSHDLFGFLHPSPFLVPTTWGHPGRASCHMRGSSRAMAVPAEQPNGGYGSVGERGPTRARGDPERDTASLRATRSVCLQPTASAWPSPESWRRDRTVICQALLSIRQGARPFEHISIVYDPCLSGMCGRYPPALQTRR